MRPGFPPRRLTPLDAVADRGSRHAIQLTTGGITSCRSTMRTTLAAELVGHDHCHRTPNSTHSSVLASRSADSQEGVDRGSELTRPTSPHSPVRIAASGSTTTRTSRSRHEQPSGQANFLAGSRCGPANPASARTFDPRRRDRDDSSPVLVPPVLQEPDRVCVIRPRTPGTGNARPRSLAARTR